MNLKSEIFVNSKDKKKMCLPESYMTYYNAVLEYRNKFFYQDKESLMFNRLYIYEILSAFLNVACGISNCLLILIKP